LSSENFLKSTIFFADNKNMKIDGYTVQEIADALNVSYNTAHKRLERLGIEPLTTGAIYPKSALETLKQVSGPGRPRKKPEEPASRKPAKK
jgi:transposase